MKLISAIVRNYRIHHERKIEFDLERTVIGGLNETGKSTLIEAIHRALFLKAKGASNLHRAMESHLHAGKPEVELKFSAGTQNYHLIKRFSGQGGTVTLTAEGGESLQGTEAETRLAQLLGVEPGAKPKACTEQWSHLWIQQGASSQNPSTLDSRPHASLIQRLSTESGASALMQSPTDQQIIETLAEEVKNLFTAKGEPRVGSELHGCIEAVDEAKKDAKAAIASRDRLHEAMASHARAQEELESLDGEARQAEEDRQKLADRKSQLQQRQVTAREREIAVASARQKLEAHLETEKNIGQVLQQLETARQTADPLRQQVQELETAVAQAREDFRQASQYDDDAVDQSRAIREQLDLVQLRREILQGQQQTKELEEKQAQVRSIQEQIAALRQERSALPEIDESDLEELEVLEAKVQRGQIELDALAAGIELLGGDLPVQVDGKPVEAGSSLTVTRPAILAIAEKTEIRITPGGGTSLEKAEQDHRQAAREHQEFLQKLGVDQRQDAGKAARQRSELSQKIKLAEARSEDLNASSLQGSLDQARETLNARQAEWPRRRSDGSDADQICQLDLAQSDERSAVLQTRVTEAQAREATARSRRVSAGKAADQRQADLTARKQELADLARHQSDFEAQLKLLTEEHGEADARQARRDELKADQAQESEGLASLQQQIAALQPDLLEKDEKRLHRVTKSISQRNIEAHNRIAVAQSQLQLDGVTDPEAQVALAQARLRQDEERQSNVKRQADAVKLLHSLFQEEQQAVAVRFTQPLLEKVGSYLEILFGRGAGASVTYGDGQFSQFAMIRPAVLHGAAVPFDDLSGGTKEQVAMAMRMAMAQVLAADFDGSLPLVLDDAFVNSDPERVRMLQRMLDHAAIQGLQVIVLTCTPADYSALGARSVTLPPMGSPS